MTTVGMDFTTIPVTAYTNLGKVIVTVIPAPQGVPPYGYVPSAGEAALNYAEGEITPYYNEVVSRVTNVILFIAILLIILLIVPLLILTVWYGVTAGIRRAYLIGSLVGVFVLFLIVGFVIYGSIYNTITTSLQAAKDDLSNIADDPDTLINILQGAANAYNTTLAS